MKKKSPTNEKRPQRRSLVYYLLFYALLIFIAIFSFAITQLILKSAKQNANCANTKTCSSDLQLKVENNVPGIFEGKKVIPPTIPMQENTPTPVLGLSIPTGEKHIYVDLSQQTLVAYQGTTQILKTFVSTGKWNRTPTGNFHIWEKLRATRMAGGEGDDAYDLPNVPYVMYFFHDFGLHGAYWHDNFGHVMSHGCVNMRQVDAKALYEWADGPANGKLGTEVSICDSITNSGQCIQNNPIE